MGRVCAEGPRGPEFVSPAPLKKLGTAAHAYNASTGDAETGGSQGFTVPARRPSISAPGLVRDYLREQGGWGAEITPQQAQAPDTLQRTWCVPCWVSHNHPSFQFLGNPTPLVLKVPTLHSSAHITTHNQNKKQSYLFIYLKQCRE